MASLVPSVILVGEIRDQETAVTRLVDLGAPEFLVRSVVRGRVLAQDLVGGCVAAAAAGRAAVPAAGPGCRGGGWRWR